MTGTTIKISISAPFSGYLGPIYQKGFTNGVETWQKEMNAKGGINGRRIVLTKVDNQFTADGAIAACKEIQSNGTFMAVSIGAFTAQDDCLDAAGIPIFEIGVGYLRPSWKNVLAFQYAPFYVPAYVSFLKSKYMNATGKPIGVVYNGDIQQQVSEFRPLLAALKEAGFRVVDTEEVHTGQASFVAEMSRMEGKGAKVVMLDVATEASLIVRDARAIGYSPQWFLGTFGATTDISAASGNVQFQGIRGVNFETTSESRGYAAFRAAVAKHQGSTAARSADTVDAGMYAVADIAGGLLTHAGRDLTRQSFMTRARTIDRYDRVHLLPPFTLLGRSAPVGNRAVFPVECCGANYTFKTIGPARERF